MITTPAKSLRLLLIAFLASTTMACSTPGEIKEAVANLDEAYASNSKAMKQYRTLVKQVNERAGYWYAHAKRRALMNTALKWATTDPPPATAVVDRDILGDDLRAVVNRVRLNGLREVREEGEERKVIFANGMSSIDDLVRALPEMANLATDRATSRFSELTGLTDDSFQGFDDYQTNVSALRRINGAIKRYLDIDVTVKADDVKEISSAIKQLQD